MVTKLIVVVVMMMIMIMLVMEDDDENVMVLPGSGLPVPSVCYQSLLSLLSAELVKPNNRLMNILANFFVLCCCCFF